MFLCIVYLNSLLYLCVFIFVYKGLKGYLCKHIGI